MRDMVKGASLRKPFKCGSAETSTQYGAGTLWGKNVLEKWRLKFQKCILMKSVIFGPTWAHLALIWGQLIQMCAHVDPYCFHLSPAP